MKIKVIKCSRNTFWYANKIGEIFTVIKAVKYPQNNGKGYQVHNNNYKKGYVDVEDAEIIFEEIK